jgi:t-SNARE complex subunit (syntaxin)
MVNFCRKTAAHILSQIFICEYFRNIDGHASQIDVEEGSSGRTQLLLQEEQNLEEIRERELAIRQLESDIVDVNTIFKDLATLVHDQVSIRCIYNYNIRIG